ncbi:hypothetical protein D3C80_1003620 [compost metagenome]
MNRSSDGFYPAMDESTTLSGVSWGAIFAGAAAAAACSLILVLLGFGLGFSAVSPWANEGVSAKGLGISTIVWLAFTQLVASGLGGYIAGRLRVKWAYMHGGAASAKLAAQQAADTAAKVAAWTTLWMFVALLAGAFFASLAATFGGRRRDAVVYLETDTYVTTASIR